MKKRIFPLFILLLFIQSNLFAQTAGAKKKAPRDTKDDCLAVIGFFNNTKYIKKITAYLYEGSTIIDSAIVNSMKDFGFILKKNKEYSIKIMSKGYYPRLISVNTKIPDDVSTVPIFVFEFEITLLPETKGVDDYFTDFPIALIDFNTKTEKFNYNKKYTENIQKELDKVEGQIRERKPK